MSAIQVAAIFSQPVATNYSFHKFIRKIFQNSGWKVTKVTIKILNTKKQQNLSFLALWQFAKRYLAKYIFATKSRDINILVLE